MAPNTERALYFQLSLPFSISGYEQDVTSVNLATFLPFPRHLRQLDQSPENHLSSFIAPFT